MNREGIQVRNDQKRDREDNKSEGLRQVHTNRSKVPTQSEVVYFTSSCVTNEPLRDSFSLHYVTQQSTEVSLDLGLSYSYGDFHRNSSKLSFDFRFTVEQHGRQTVKFENFTCKK